MKTAISITLKMFRADLLRKKIIASILFLFVMIATFLATSSANMIMELMNSLNYLFAQSNVPHYVQMNFGQINPSDINNWALHNSFVKKNQIVEMLRIDQSNIYIGDKRISEKNSVMNNDFVMQNHLFDFLFNLKGQIIYPSRGEIAVPVYYMQLYNLKIGDKIRILSKTFKKEFTIVDFVRDVQMNPSIIHSKRFLINSEDFLDLQKVKPQYVYLIEFQLFDLKKLNQFSNEYQFSKLPKNGPTIYYLLYKILNSITDGFIIGIITLLSILLIIVAILSLRFIILTTIEEDYKEIGIMMAIGIPQRYIKRFYLSKYVFVSGLACIIGSFLAFFSKKIFITNIMLYLGLAPKSFFQSLIPWLSAFLIFLIVFFSCVLILRKFNTISAVETLRTEVVESLQKHKYYLPLNRNRYLNINVFLGIQDVFQRWNKFILLFIVFLVCSFVLVLPINFLNTIKSPNFMTFIGVEKSDMRIDLQQSDHSMYEFNRIISYLKNDQSVRQYSTKIASRFQFKSNDRQVGIINIEAGNFSIFPIHYLRGIAPLHDNEISLSYLNSKQLKKDVGDHLQLIVKGIIKDLLITGIYQDVTNGGVTAKSLLPFDSNTILWYVINIDFKANTNLYFAKNVYATLSPLSRVTYVNDYLKQTLGDLIKQIKMISILTFIAAMFIAVIITSLFLKLWVAKHSSQIAIMKVIGFSANNIRLQYLTRSILILNLGILAGVLISNTLGQSLVSLAWSIMGAPKIKFIINPIQIYIICPLLLMFVVIITTIFSVGLIKKINITKMIVE